MIKLPEEFESRMKEMLGDEYEDFRASYDEKKKTGIRVNTLKESVEDFKRIFPYELSTVKWCDTGFEAVTDEKYGRSALHDAGAFYMQEPSAMAVAASLAGICDLKGKRVLDLCAAPGGKSTQLASYMQGQGILVSNEINRDRANILSSNIERCGVKNAVVLNETPEKIAQNFEEFFDVVVVDAPCSGEGMFRKDETAVKEWSEDNVKMCAERQKDILDEAVKTVAENGYLVYSTCTFAPAEDEEQIIDFLKRYPEFEAVPVPGFKYFDIGQREWLETPADESIIKKCARLWPHKIDGEGHFICILKRAGKNSDGDFTESAPDKSGKKNKSSDKGPNKELRVDRKSAETIASFMRDNLKDFGFDRERTVCFKDSVYLLPEGFNKDLKGLKVIRLGIHLGDIKKERFEPSHSLAMVLSKDNARRAVELDEDEALKFRHGEELKKDCENGWTLVCVGGVSLGWCKAVNGSLKNHYPKGLRIKF